MLQAAIEENRLDFHHITIMLTLVSNIYIIYCTQGLRMCPQDIISGKDVPSS